MIANTGDNPRIDHDAILRDCRWTTVPARLCGKPVLEEELTNGERMVGPPLAILNLGRHIVQMRLCQRSRRDSP
jgi:hypothetical protein